MKKILFTLFALLTIGSAAYGDDQIKVDKKVYLSTSGTTDFLVFFNPDANSSVSGIQFNIQLPTGVEFATGTNGSPLFKRGTTFDKDPEVNIVDGVLKVAMSSSNPIKGSQGMLIAFKVQPSTSFNGSNGDVLTGAKIFNIKESKNGSVDLSDCNFSFIVTNQIVLDENSPFVPSGASGVDVLVKRTINKNTWSTIYLPLNLNNNKTKIAFGDNVKIAEFKEWECDLDGQIVNSININFKSLGTPLIKKGTPYLIYVDKNIEEFTVSGASIDNSDGKVVIDGDIYDDDEMEYAKGTMSGAFNLHAMNLNDMFLQNNTFYYAREGQNIKGFRATFRFKSPKGVDYIISNSSGSRGMFTIDGNPIDDNTTAIRNRYITKTGKVYSVTGRYMGENVNMKSLPKGIYIVDGVKIVNE